MKLLIDSNRGIYSYQELARRIHYWYSPGEGFQFSLTVDDETYTTGNLYREDVEVLRAGPDHEEYLDCVEAVLDVEWYKDGEVYYTLSQDDLWLVKETEDVSEIYA